MQIMSVIDTLPVRSGSTRSDGVQTGWATCSSGPWHFSFDASEELILLPSRSPLTCTVFIPARETVAPRPNLLLQPCLSRYSYPRLSLCLPAPSVDTEFAGDHVS